LQNRVSAAGIGMQGMAGGGLLSVRTWTAGRRSIYTTVRSPRRLLPPDRNRKTLVSYTWLHAYVHQNLFYFVYVLDDSGSATNKQTKIYKTFRETALLAPGRPDPGASIRTRRRRRISARPRFHPEHETRNIPTRAGGRIERNPVTRGNPLPPSPDLTQNLQRPHASRGTDRMQPGRARGSAPPISRPSSCPQSNYRPLSTLQHPHLANCTLQHHADIERYN
jgi:hypothetical protein